MSALLKKLIQVAVPVSAVLVSSAALAGISTTKHNLGTGGTNTNHVTGGTDTAEICIFCHTPHGAAQSADNPPLWNKNLPTTTYTTYTSTTMDAAGTGASGAISIGSVSLACLSCHDGTQAMDNILNAPGSGGYNVTGGGANGLGYTWANPGAAGTGGTSTEGALQNHGTFIAALGSDLSNDHPIGIAYCGWSSKVGAVPAGTFVPSTDCADPDFNPARRVGTNNQWYVNTGTDDAVKQKTDMILYTRTFTVGGTGPSVECASCHDPHTANTTFLRVENTNSAVCLACHNK